MVGLLFALPNTQLTRRLASEGRLHTNLLPAPDAGIDQATQGLNFKTLRPEEDILYDFKRVLEHVYEPVAYAGRLHRLASLLGNSNPNRRPRVYDSKMKLSGLGIVRRLLSDLQDGQDAFRNAITDCASVHPQWAPTIVMLAAFYLHLGPFSREVIYQIERRLDHSEGKRELRRRLLG